MTKAEKEHLSKVASIGCIACRLMGYEGTPAEIHHIGNGTMSKRASNYETIPLCHFHHRTGGHGNAVHAGRKTFESRFKTEKEFLADTLELIR